MGTWYDLGVFETVGAESMCVFFFFCLFRNGNFAGVGAMLLNAKTARSSFSFPIIITIIYLFFAQFTIKTK